MRIQILSPEIVSRIAAGEVIERPASVVKELVENSLDAGASEITVEVSGGGIIQIRVVDNGTGIMSNEVEAAFQRYATSKINTIRDIENVATLGFRGEALPSIASAAQVEMLTRSAEENSGTFIQLDNGVIRNKISQAAPGGASVTVKNLFRKIPARLKFLKSVAVENSHISFMVGQFSLSFPEVKFTLFIDGRNHLRTSGSGNLIEAIASVYGLTVARQMMELGSKTSTVYGYISPPSLNRSNRSYISFFVNRRWTQSRMLTRAAEYAYQGMLMTGRHPVVVINLSLPLPEVDVNVHPSKAEVRFQNEGAIFNKVSSAIIQLLADKTGAPEVYPDRKAAAAGPAQKELNLTAEDFMPVDNPLPQPAVLKNPVRLPLLRVLGQVSNSYIIAEGPDGVYLLDQHAAHERILFEKMLVQYKNNKVEVQGLLSPVAVELSAQQEQLYRMNGTVLSEFGFEIEPFGERVLLVRAIPAVLTSSDIASTVLEILDSGLGDKENRIWEERMAVSIACHGAIKAGQVLKFEEMMKLLQELEKTGQPRTCPHGRPTMIHLSSTQLQKEFGRI